MFHRRALTYGPPRYVHRAGSITRRSDWTSCWGSRSNVCNPQYGPWTDCCAVIQCDNVARCDDKRDTAYRHKNQQTDESSSYFQVICYLWIELIVGLINIHQKEIGSNHIPRIISILEAHVACRVSSVIGTVTYSNHITVSFKHSSSSCHSPWNS
jgi:hypothetical protein